MMKYLYLLIALGAAGPAFAETCKVPAGWSNPVPHASARKLPLKFALSVGPATRLTLSPAAVVKLPVASDHSPKPDTMAGLAAFDITRAGRLAVALSTAAYVDLVRDSKILASVGHRHADACTGIRKTVTFDVLPGRYFVQLSDAPDKSIVMQATLG